jgi:hypothetical protein
VFTLGARPSPDLALAAPPRFELRSRARPDQVRAARAVHGVAPCARAPGNYVVCLEPDDGIHP